MSKSADAFRTISEVADDLGIPKHVLRFWEVKFAQIRPMKRGGGRRYYRPEDMELLKGIQHLLHRDGYTIKGVQKILREQGIEVVKTHAAQPVSAAAVSGEAAPSTLPAEGLRLMNVTPQPGKAARPAKVAARGSAPGPGQGPALGPAVAAAIAELEACRALLRGEPLPATAVAHRSRAGGSR